MNSAAWVLSHDWAIRPEMLETIISIATRQASVEDFKALQTRDSDPLEGTRKAEVRDNIAIIPVIGPIFPRANIFTSISGATSIQTLAKDFTAAVENADVNGILLFIDSPGGEVAGVNEFQKVIKAARGVKPITAYIFGTGASAAYWIASAADKIIIDETSVVGSIGVVAGVQQSSSKTIEIVSSRAPKKRVDIETDDGKAEILKRINALEEVFVNAVAENRSVSVESVVNDFGQGGVLVGKYALEAGMVDGINTFENVLTAMINDFKKPTLIGKGVFMNLEELKAQHPEVYQAACAEGAEAERNRIKSIEAIAVPGAEKIIEEHKYNGSSSAESVAVLIVKEQKKAAEQAKTDIETDASDVAGDLKKLDNTPPPTGEDTSVEKEIDLAFENLKKAKLK
jgi:ClpP class serine protease